MKHAPIQLAHYRVHQFTFSGNDQYDEEKGYSFFVDNFSVTPSISLVSDPHHEKEGSGWAVRLEITQEESETSNLPYHYHLELEGMIVVNPSVPEEKVEQIVSSNGTALLYGVAREIIRNMTSLGAYHPVIIPSTHFLPDSEKKKS